uniref:ATP synthase subunit a n=1 Tax=Amphiura sinicola TaxID=2705302 RepID=A0A6C0FEM5_9ECHI|nr:ATP synthase F0 subunit 6 [Amphiura sinicola]QHT54212.1 ATP synthase F0 subunit 6 [Amphiura sinicola]
MILNINNIFAQFIPTSFLSTSILLISILLATLWLIISNHTHWALNRSRLTSTTLEITFNSLINPSNNPQNIWSKWLLATFLLIITFNLCSLIPYTFAPTSHFSITFSLSIPLWASIQIIGIILNPKAKISHLVPNGTPSLLIPLMVVIETVSLLIQPLTLGFRLGANLLAGHLLILLCSCVVWVSINLGLIGYLSFILLFLLFLLEIAVAIIQASVFIILTKQYLEENTT